ncbi:hypothetical protein T06_7388, partial [Trichinella sp. T6]
LNPNCSIQLKLVDCIIQKLFQFMYHCINYFLENFNFYYSSCCSLNYFLVPFALNTVLSLPVYI